MMKIVAVVSQKGGAGKTTLAVHLATAAHLAGYGTAILDLDPQATAETWGQWRKDKPPEVMSVKPPTLARAIDKAREAEADFLVLDTPGAAEGASLAAARVADLILIPCRPRSFDLAAIQQTAILAESTGKPMWLVFNATANRGQVRLEAREVVGAIGLSIAPVQLAERAAFHKATEQGLTAQETEPDGKAAVEINALWRWTCEQINLLPRKQPRVRTGRRK